MPVHAFVDESKKNGLLIVAAIVPVEHVQATRKTMNSLLLKNQRRIHFRYERDPRRKQIIDVVTTMPLSALAYAARPGSGELQARRACLIQLTHDLRQLDGTRLVLERDDSLVEHDRRWLFEAVRSSRFELDYVHLRAHEDSLLWIPDIVAWCWAAGCVWRERIRCVVSSQTEV